MSAILSIFFGLALLAAGLHIGWPNWKPLVSSFFAGALFGMGVLLLASCSAASPARCPEWAVLVWPDPARPGPRFAGATIVKECAASLGEGSLTYFPSEEEALLQRYTRMME